ncbi:MAG TPA: hypothetical protein VHV51_12470 [Polyangiaceae bacterium]|jgi:hypothetical protein|nr:hypothetical protein [Polyangiaceae bacterium]
MSDPHHLTDEGSEASEFERELLQAAQGVGLSVGEKRAIWASVALAAGPVAANPGAHSLAPSAAAKSAAALPWLKVLAVLAGLGGISAGIFGWQRGSSRAAQRTTDRAALSAPSATTSAVPPPDSDTPTTTPAESTSNESANGAALAPSASSAASSRDAVPVEAKSALRDESLAVLEIRRTLRAGDANGALHLLEQARQRFPRGALGQEREALSIEALAKSGARDAAARQAAAFLRAHPKSPYAADVQSFASP